MQNKRTFGNYVMVKLDKENDEIKLESGVKLYLDTTYEPEKHVTVTGTVCGLPKRLTYTGLPDAMPWKTHMELKYGDKVIMYYLSVVNAMAPEASRSMTKDGERYVWVKYQNIYAAIRNQLIVPINGYCLIEPMEDQSWLDMGKRMKEAGLEAVRLKVKSNVNVVYGRVKYAGRPNDAYVDGQSDDMVNVNPGDRVVMRKISDIPMEYDLHASIDGGAKYWRVQRRRILAKL